MKLTQIKFYKIDHFTKEDLQTVRDIARGSSCIIRLMWKPNKWNPEQSISITEDTTDESIDNIISWSKGPWGM